MHALHDLYAYNAWANARVFATCHELDQSQLNAEAPGTYGSIAETLKHLVSVEDVYFHMLRGISPQQMGRREDYHEQSVEWFAARSEQLGAEYQQLLDGADDAFYAGTLDVPWFDFALTRYDGLLQVLSHSAQHRAQVFSVAGERGVPVPNLDYVVYVESRGTAPK
jgi:uncharacterized damage-inducible protein DinB